MKTKSNNIINFLFEAATLKRLKRTGWQILGGNEESVAEHSFMAAVISYVLANQLKADTEKVLLMALFHDLSETRTGDVYKLADLYVKTDEHKANKDALHGLPNSNELIMMIKEYEKEKTLELLSDIYVTDKKYRLPACIDKRAQIYEVEGQHTIWHFSLEHENYYMNYGVFANGLLVETASNRMMLECSGLNIV